MVDTGDLKSPAGNGVRVQLPPATFEFCLIFYLIRIALTAILPLTLFFFV
jgi:hypothetical protein